MDAEAILAELRYNTGKLPREALLAAIENREQITPLLLKELQEARQNPDILYHDNYMEHIYAMYLLAQFREKAAYPEIVAFVSQPGTIVMDCTGDVVPQDLNRILASVAHGDTVLIKALAENSKADEWVRGAALTTLMTQVIQGELTREEVMAYYQGLFRGGLKRKPSQVWNELACCATDLHPAEVIDDIRKAYAEELVDWGVMGLDEVEEDLLKTKERMLDRLANKREYRLIENILDDIKWWACFETVEHKPLKIPERFDPERIYQPLPFAELKVGRNDPCPCGSGKKYKKCCGKE